MVEERDISADLEWLVRRTRDGYEPEKIILFGSLACGDTHEASDMDLIVVKDTIRATVRGLSPCAFAPRPARGSKSSRDLEPVI